MQVRRVDDSVLQVHILVAPGEDIVQRTVDSELPCGAVEVGRIFRETDLKSETCKGIPDVAFFLEPDVSVDIAAVGPGDPVVLTELLERVRTVPEVDRSTVAGDLDGAVAKHSSATSTDFADPCTDDVAGVAESTGYPV